MGEHTSSGGDHLRLTTFSPLIGGTFAEPATEHPRWLDFALFRTYPYLLPCAISAILAFVAAFVSVTYLLEVRFKLSAPIPG